VPAGPRGNAAALERAGGRRRDQPQADKDREDQNADGDLLRPPDPGQHRRHHAEDAQGRSSVSGPQTRKTVLVEMSRFVSELGHGSSGTKNA